MDVEFCNDLYINRPTFSKFFFGKNLLADDDCIVRPEKPPAFQ